MQARTGARFQLRVAGTPLVDASRFDAVLFDLDGVLTATAQIHAASWKRTFDEFLAEWGDAHTVEHTVEPQAFTIDGDYPTWVDGKTREDGVRDFLRSRGIDIPEGAADAPATEWSIHGIGRRKQQYVDETFRAGGVSAFPGSVAWLREFRAAGLLTAVVTSSRNAAAVLDAAGIADQFDTRVDGTTIASLGLAGKPAPDAFLEAARRLGVVPERGVVVEDARGACAPDTTAGSGSSSASIAPGTPTTCARPGPMSWCATSPSS